jgi:uncharacterized cupin superfamily protein
VTSEVLSQRVRTVSKLPARERPAHGPVIEGFMDKHELSSAPIPDDWILEGNPVARNKCVASSTDGTASTYIWECTAGRFNWFYGVDETVYLLQGSITVTDGVESHTLSAGDTFFFASGTQYEWTIDTYVRKVAFMHVPRSRKLRMLVKVLTAMRHPLRAFRKSSGPQLTGLAAVSSRQE